MGNFKIDATNFSWINGDKDDEKDLCLHGYVTAIIGERKLEDDATVSATALYLLKTLTENHIIYEDNQMIPCCGHFLIPNDDLTIFNTREEKESIIGVHAGLTEDSISNPSLCIWASFPSTLR